MQQYLYLMRPKSYNDSVFPNMSMFVCGVVVPVFIFIFGKLCKKLVLLKLYPCLRLHLVIVLGLSTSLITGVVVATPGTHVLYYCYCQPSASAFSIAAVSEHTSSYDEPSTQTMVLNQARDD